jgi:hypothetical protein
MIVKAVYTVTRGYDVLKFLNKIQGGGKDEPCCQKCVRIRDI